MKFHIKKYARKIIFSIISSHLTALAKQSKGSLGLKIKIDFLFIDSLFLYVLVMDYKLASTWKAALEESQLQLAIKSIYSKQAR